MKPIESILPYSKGITVERPEPVGDYKVPDGRYSTGLKGRLVELLIDGVETVIISLYLLPHTSIVAEAVTAAQKTGLPIRCRTIADAVGSDITNVVRNCIAEDRFGPAVYLFSTYLAQDLCVAVSEYTKQLIVESARDVDAACGTSFAEECQRRVGVSYPAIDTEAFANLDVASATSALERRGLRRNQYVLFLSRIARAKGVDDLVRAYKQSRCHGHLPLVLAGSGPAVAELREQIGDDPNIRLLTDVDDNEKCALMNGCAAYVLPSKPQPEFVETFGIALAEKMLLGGRGPVITTDTGGIPEAVGDGALRIEAGSIASISRVLDYAIFEMSDLDKQRLSQLALHHALQFDRQTVFDRLLGRLQLTNLTPSLDVAVG